MKILYQGGWQEGRDDPASRQIIEEYCRSLGRNVAKSRHQIILTTMWAYEDLIAEEMHVNLKGTGKDLKDVLEYYISNKESMIPKFGKVIQYFGHKWFDTERTLFIQRADAVVIIGGGRGAVDCMQKALLAGKPVFVAGAINSKTSEYWKNQSIDYFYLKPGDTEFTLDLNITADEFFGKMIRILDEMDAQRFSRKIFIVHGHDERPREQLAAILKSLEFEPIVLMQEPGRSQTIIEHIEEKAPDAGFGFIIYSANDQGAATGEKLRPRARQNVIFEHGLLIGYLGRDRTCALIASKDIEIPSDLHGVIYEQFNDLEHESLKIVKILKDAGYAVDPNLLM